MVIAFSGLDGAGKSTLVECLREALARGGHPVTVLHMDQDVGLYAYLRWGRNWVVRVIGRRPTRPHAAQPGPPPVHPSRFRRIRNALVWSATARGCVYVIDLLLFALQRIWLETVMKRVLVMDRYFYDTLVDLSVRSHRSRYRLLELVTPRPDVPVLLEVPPEQAFTRKGEYSVDYLRRRWTEYQSVFSRVPTCVRLTNTELHTARARLWRIVMVRMRGPLGRGTRWLPGVDRAGEDA